jgi:lipooligosaccharide transport system ATP-binding protein
LRVNTASPLSVAGLRKTYGGKEVVCGVDLTLQPGECFGLLGPNGAGKTTTLRLCLGLTGPDGGSIHVLGHEVPQQGREARARIGVVPQFDNLDPDFTIRENLRVFGRYFDIPDATLRERIPALLEFAGLSSRADTRIQTLSGGMKRRLTLARALINDPELLFLDEPTTGLDPQARHVIWERLRNLLKQGKTLLLTTHFMEEAERLCSRIAIMDHGKIITGGDPRALIAQHVEPHVVEVYGEGAPDWAEAFGRRHAERCEITGETIFCYTNDPAPLIADLDSRGDLRYLHRRANIEDVFLKLTGRDLRD